MVASMLNVPESSSDDIQTCAPLRPTMLRLVAETRCRCWSPVRSAKMQPNGSNWAHNSYIVNLDAIL